MKTILVVGNEIEECDSIAIQVVQQIKEDFQNITFLHWDPTEELPGLLDNDIVLIDTIQGIHHVKIFETIEDFSKSPRNTVHDFDLPIALGLLSKIKKIKTIKIFGIPMNEDLKKSKKELYELLTKYFR